MFGERALQVTEGIMLKWRLLVEERRKSQCSAGLETGMVE